MANDQDARGIEVWGSDTSVLGDAVSLTPIRYGAPNAVLNFTEASLGSSETRYYWARTVGPAGSVSDFSSSVSATTDP